MRKTIAFLALAAAPCMAQNTNCQTYGNQTSCQTYPQGSGVDWGLANRAQGDIGDLTVQAMNRARQLQQQRQEQARADASAQQHQALQQQAGALVAAGRCQDARAVALNAGDFALAQSVASVCR